MQSDDADLADYEDAPLSLDSDLDTKSKNPDNQKDKKSKKRKAEDASNSSSSSDATSESKQKKTKQRVDICAGKPTQEIVYKDCAFGVDLKIMQATCKHPIYTTDEVSKGVAEGHVWNIDTAVLDVSTAVMREVLQAIHRPFQLNQNSDSFVKWAQMFIVADYLLHNDLYELARTKCDNSRSLVVSLDEWQDLVCVLQRRHIATKEQLQDIEAPYPTKVWIYANAVTMFCRFRAEDRDSDKAQACLQGLRQVGVSQLPDAVVRDVLRAMIAKKDARTEEIAPILAE